MLELLPTVTGNVLNALDSEQITRELQEKKLERLGRNASASENMFSEMSSVAPDEDGKSFSSKNFVHTSRLGSSSSVGEQPRPTRTKAQLWNDLKISCRLPVGAMYRPSLTGISHYPNFHPALHPLPSKPSDAYTTEPPWSKKLCFQCGVPSLSISPKIDDQP